MKKFLLLVSLSFITLQATAESRLPYPEIQNLKNDDVFFNQYSVAVSQSRKVIASLDANADISPEFYTYVVKPEDSLISIAARCCIPYDAIATLNRIDSIDEDIEGRRLMLPSLPALYVYEQPNTAIERLVHAYVDKVASDFEGFELAIFTDSQKSIKIYCLPNALFDGTVRAFFFLPYYQFPLESRRITSGFGMRRDPFTGRYVHHDGIDIAAPCGVSVYAITSGVIIYTGYDRILGWHVILKHNDGRESVYGHLSKIIVKKGDKVKTGMALGAVGSTGRSTGNHLHLEIRESSIPTDPIKFFKD